MKQSHNTLRLGSVLSLVIFLLVLGGPAMAAYAATAAPANGGMVNGWVTSPGGYPLPAGTLVKLFDANVETVRGLAAPDPADGSFHIGPVPNGLYVIKAVPPAGSAYTQSLPRPLSVVNAPVSAGHLALTLPQVNGTVTAPDGITLVNAEVFVYLGDGQVLQQVEAPGGEFHIGGLPVGGYGLQAFPATNQPLWKSEISPLSIQHPADEITVTLTATARCG
jgi:hypothetical protein